MSRLSPDVHARHGAAISTALALALGLPTFACLAAGRAPQTSTSAESPAYRNESMAPAPPADASARSVFRLFDASGDEGPSLDKNMEVTVAENGTSGGAAGLTMGQNQGTPPGTPQKNPQATPPQQTPPAGPGNQTGAVEKNKTEGKKLKQALVVEGSLTLEVKEVPEAAEAIRDYIDKIDGRVTSEQLSGGERSWSGHMQLKLPPEKVDEFLTWMAERGDISNKHIRGTDVSRTLFDQKIALDNLELTLSRMRKLLDKEGLVMKDVLAIEREMTRLRGEIERIKGEKRFLEYRVAMATLDVHLRRREGVILGHAKAKFYPGVRLSALTLLDANGRQKVRMGGGVVVHTIPRLTLELDIFQAPDDESRAVIATFGGSTYSDFLGRGKRRFLNPYLGIRLGYGYLDGSAFVFAAGGGVELFKHKYFLLDASVNYVGFVRKEFDSTVATSLSAVFAF